MVSSGQEHEQTMRASGRGVQINAREFIRMLRQRQGGYVFDLYRFLSTRAIDNVGWGAIIILNNS
ncbi:MAG: hypothetical protein IT331_18055 [Anaerolineae bacterium]|nr:hypothetical protein [Anaerolineae bacterium]